jgi:hypothetical protein
LIVEKEMGIGEGLSVSRFYFLQCYVGEMMKVNIIPSGFYLQFDEFFFLLSEFLCADRSTTKIVVLPWACNMYSHQNLNKP